MSSPFQKFWVWYERHYVLNSALTAGLFLIQIIHLYWLTTDVAIPRLTGESLVTFAPWFETLIILVDYTEIPALFSVSLLYINELRKGFSLQPVIYLILLNSQWLHIFWITDEFVVNRFAVTPEIEPHTHGGEMQTILPVWLAWVAILIDYLEIPVMVDTMFKFLKATNSSSNLRQLIRSLRS